MKKTKLTSEEVKHIARLASLNLSEEEVKKYQKELSETLDYIENLNEVDTKNTEPTSQVTGLKNVTREDESEPSLQTHNNFFKIKAIM